MFKYFGSKRRLAPTYQPPHHDLIVEPFAGAAAYAVYWLTRASQTRAVLIDKDPQVIDLWDRLLSMTPTEISEYPDPQVGDRTDDLLWLTSASAMSVWGAVRNSGEAQVTERQFHDWPGVKWRMAQDRALIGDRDRVDLMVGDYTDATNTEATWFIDPPYQSQGVWYVENGSSIVWPDLARWCQSRNGQIIVCEASPADWLPFEPHRMALNQESWETLELVWYSHPDPTLFDHIE